MDVGDLQEIRSQFLLESGLSNGEHAFAVGEYGFFLVDGLQIKGDQTRHPAAAMDHVGRPAKLFNGLEGALTIEHCTQAIVVKPLIIFVVKNELAFEKILVIQKINLKAGVGKRSYFDLQGKSSLSTETLIPERRTTS